MRVRRLGAVLALFVLAACDSGVIVDDWGPPAGYTAVEGKVTKGSTGGAVAGAEVRITGCDDLVSEHLGGYLGRAITNAQGNYRVERSLPPAGFLRQISVDTLRVRCDVFVGGATLPLDSIRVRFFTRKEEVVPLRLDLVLP